MTQYFFMPRYFECKQADIELSKNKVSKNHCFQKSPGGGGFHIWPMDYMARHQYVGAVCLAVQIYSDIERDQIPCEYAAFTNEIIVCVTTY